MHNIIIALGFTSYKIIDYLPLLLLAIARPLSAKNYTLYRMLPLFCKEDTEGKRIEQLQVELMPASQLYVRLQHKLLQIFRCQYHTFTLQTCSIISIINHTLPNTIRAVIDTLTCRSMASNSTSDSECYQAVRVQV